MGQDEKLHAQLFVENERVSAGVKEGESELEKKPR